MIIELTPKHERMMSASCIPVVITMRSLDAVFGFADCERYSTNRRVR